MSFSTINELIVKVINWLSRVLKWEMPEIDPSTITETTPSTAPEAQNSPLEPSTPQTQPIQPTPSPEPILSLDDFCLAIRDFEGKPGDRNYKNNNPGNCKFFYGGYLPIYEPVKRDKDGFAIFKDYDTGWLYLRNMVKNIAKKHPQWSITTFISVYAPASDNNPVLNYAKFIAKRLGVDTSFTIGNLV